MSKFLVINGSKSSVSLFQRDYSIRFQHRLPYSGYKIRTHVSESNLSKMNPKETKSIYVYQEKEIKGKHIRDIDMPTMHLYSDFVKLD